MQPNFSMPVGKFMNSIDTFLVKIDFLSYFVFVSSSFFTTMTSLTVPTNRLNAITYKCNWEAIGQFYELDSLLAI